MNGNDAATVPDPPKQQLLVAVDRLRFAIPVASVRELLELPWLTPLSEAPAATAGAFRLGATIVPVIDLRVFLHKAARERRLSDVVAVLDVGNRAIGLLVDEALDVSLLDGPVEKTTETKPGVTAGEARWRDEIVQVLDLGRLLEPGHARHKDLGGLSGGDIATPELTWPERDADVMARFRDRARVLADRLENVSRDESHVVTVIARWGNECFALGPENIREFITFTGYTRVPSAPEHVLGVLNLRGDILPLLDIRGSLHVERTGELSKGIVLETASGNLGVAVHEIIDVVAIDNIASPSKTSAEPAHGGPHAIPYGGSFIPFIDLNDIVRSFDAPAPQE